MEEYMWSFNKFGRLRDAEREASKASDTATEAVSQMDGLTSQVERLTLACQAMWEIVRDRTDITEEELAKKIEEIDLRDGVADGKLGSVVVECPGCGRNTNSRRQSCVWCGEPIERVHAFEG